MNTHKHYESARRAHGWTSFSPEKRAASECAYFDEIMTEFSDNEQVKAKFERLFLLSLAAKSRCASSAITGPARFPVEKQMRASERERKISDEMTGYIDRVRKAIKQEAYYAEHPEARPVMANDENAVEKLQHKLETLEAKQKTMVEANKLIRKGDRDGLVALVGLTTSELLLKPDFCGRVGYASFELTNNNAKIKATRERIEQITNRKATEPKDITINGVRVLENNEAMRLQLFFNGKPAQTIITLLKSHGFKWSPSNMAWQRQLTNNAIYSFNNFVLPVLKEAA